jgi:transcription termination/antitermination protein NusG
MGEELTEQPKNRRVFRLGDSVRIVSGPFAAFTGKIEGINQAKALLKVKVTIFGRVEPVKLNFWEVENASRL